MGKGGLYGKRKKQDRPRSFKEETESSGGERTSRTAEAVKRYGSYTVRQGYDTSLTTTQRRKYERKRGNK